MKIALIIQRAIFLPTIRNYTDIKNNYWLFDGEIKK